MFATSKSADAVYLSGGDGVADAIDFDGTNDYLSRASDLIGNADGKTFTFSCWVDVRNLGGSPVLYANNGGAVSIGLTTTGLRVVATNVATGTTGLLFTCPSPSTSSAGGSTLLHILFSVSMSNTADRSVYVNDVLQTVTWTTYVNSPLAFVGTSHAIASATNLSGKYGGRLSHLYLDYTYRDLSVEANRRLFITADRKPALNQQALNPILYLPLSDPTQPGKNLGTGGQFNLTGTVARSGRGPSQFNAPYSDMNGSNQYIGRATALSGITDGKQLTFSCCFNADTHGTNGGVLGISTASGPIFLVRYNSSNTVVISADDSSGATLVLSGTFSVGILRNFTIVTSIDLSSTVKRKVFLNGSEVSVTWDVYDNQNIGFSGSTSAYVGILQSGSTQYFNGRLGNVFFDTKYIDLSQPANLAKFVTGTGIDAKPVDLGANGEKPFGAPPLIYLPMYGNNAGKNYGSGGDFTVNFGPYPGARGPNEFWGNKADFDGSTGYLARTSALTGVSDSKTFSASFFLTVDVSALAIDIFAITTAGNSQRLLFQRNVSNNIQVSANDSAGTSLFTNETSGGVVTAGTAVSVQLCFNTDSGIGLVYLNGTQYNIGSNPGTPQLSAPTQYFGQSISGSKLDGKLSEFYFTTDYIDFGQEANRLKFRDAFGNPVDLTPQIEAGTLPNPAIYMRFDPANQGKNYGTGGDFVKNGTILDGGQL